MAAAINAAALMYMNNFPEIIRFNFGIYVEKFVKWLMHSHGGFFDAIGDGLLWFLLRIESLLIWLPWWLVIAVIFLLGWRMKSIKAGIIYSIFFFSIGAFGLWDLTMSTLSIVLTSVVISLAFGVPLGIMMAYKAKFDLLMRPLLDGMQTMPSFVYLIPAIMLFGLGRVPAVFATIIYAIPPVIRLTNLGIRNVPREMVEAAHSFGSSAAQTLFKVQLPQALPTIMAGINQTTMMALSMVVIASMIGAKGLGMEVLTAISRIDIAGGFDAGFSIVILAIIIDRISQGAVDKFKVS